MSSGKDCRRQGFKNISTDEKDEKEISLEDTKKLLSSERSAGEVRLSEPIISYIIGLK